MLTEFIKLFSEFIKLFLEFFKIGLITFGGGQAMIPVLERELVTDLQWITMENFLYFVSIAEITPGPVSINMATFIGANLFNVAGAIVTTGGVILPSFVIIVLIAKFFKKAQRCPIFDSFMMGVKPVLPALFMSAIYLIIINGFSGIYPFIIAAAAFVAIIKTKLNPLILLLVTGMISLFIL